MRKVLYTSTDARTPWWDTITGGYLQRYCEKYGIELVNITEGMDISAKRLQPQWVIFDAMRMSLDLPDGTLCGWVDSDMVIHDDAPDIFSLLDRLIFCPPDPRNKVHARMRRMARQFDMPNFRPYLISGVVRWSKRHVVGLLRWFEENKEKCARYYGDQELLCAAAYYTETYFTYFPYTWHRNITAVDNPHIGFLHAGGGRKGKKLKILEDLVVKRREDNAKRSALVARRAARREARAVRLAAGQPALTGAASEFQKNFSSSTSPSDNPQPL